MKSALLILLFLALVTAQNITETVRNNSVVVYPTILPNGSVVVAPVPQVKQAAPKMRCNETEFCFEVIPAAMGAYVKGVMKVSVASAVFTGEGNSRGFKVAYINQNATKREKPSFPSKTHSNSTITTANGTHLVEIYRFNRKAAKVEAFDNMTAVKNLSSQPLLGLYSPLLLPPNQQNYSIVLINLPADTKNYTLTFRLPDNTNRTYIFQRQNIKGVFLRGSDEITFEAPDLKTNSTVAPNTTSGAYRVFPFGILLMSFPMFAH